MMNMKILISDFRKMVKNLIPHDEYNIEKMTIKNDGEKGFRLTLYKPKNNLHLLNIENMGLEVWYRESFSEPSYRHVTCYVQKSV